MTKTVGSGAQQLELREYEGARWVSTNASAPSMDSAMGGAFMALFRYISGTNAAGARVHGNCFPATGRHVSSGAHR